MHRWDPSKIGIPGLALLSVAVLVVALGVFLETRRVQTLTIAAGSARGESYLLAQALKTVVERHHPTIRLHIRETAGTSENLQLLDAKGAQLATAQADIPTGSTARLVVYLYDDVFQLLVPAESKIKTFVDLQGKRIALPPKGGQYASFLAVAAHFGLLPADFQFIGQDEPAADQAFQSGQADALFRVRALGNPFLTRLAHQQNIRFIPIQQAAAMRIQLPALETSLIPEGAYRGHPPIPPADLPSVAVRRTLLAHRNANPAAIQAITQTLIERRQEIADSIQPEYAELKPILAGLKAPEIQSGLGAEIHQGARDYLERDKPGFIQSHADYLGLIVTLVVLGGSWLWELKRLIERRQKNQADEFSAKVVVLMNEARACADLNLLAGIEESLLDLLTSAVRDLDDDKLSEDSFQTFRAVLQIALDVVKRRRLAF
jgi:uncharacterized protein